MDASVLMALINQEQGAEHLTLELMSDAAISTVNLAEVQTKLVSEGGDPDVAWADALGPIREAIPFTAEQAKTAGSLVSKTRQCGLSLGDRACLALGLALNAHVYTADKCWENLNIGVRIHVIR